MSFEDKTMTDLGPWTYEVRAVNSAGNSAWTFTTTPIAPVGGPDITVHLLKIRRALRNWYNNTLTPAQQQAFKDEWVTSVSGLLWDLRFDPVKVTNNAGNWDIQELMKQSAQTTHNDGVLPNGIHTVTVAGHVYPDDEVNYWLYGCLGDLLGWSQQGILGLIQFYRNQRWKGTGIVGRWAWTLAGWADDQTLPSTISTTGTAFATYGPVAGALPAASPPASEEIGPMIYEAGFGMLGIGRIFDKQ
jgi:hypothetical protein